MHCETSRRLVVGNSSIVCPPNVCVCGYMLEITCRVFLIVSTDWSAYASTLQHNVTLLDILQTFIIIYFAFHNATRYICFADSRKFWGIIATSPAPSHKPLLIILYHFCTFGKEFIKVDTLLWTFRIPRFTCMKGAKPRHYFRWTVASASNSINSTQKGLRAMCQYSRIHNTHSEQMAKTR